MSEWNKGNGKDLTIILIIGHYIRQKTIQTQNQSKGTPYILMQVKRDQEDS